MSSPSSCRVSCVALLGLAPVLGCSRGTEDSAVRVIYPRPETRANLASDRPPPLDCTGKDGVRAEDERRIQEVWAKYLGRKVEEIIELADGVTMSFVLIPPGKFLMGSPDDEKPLWEDVAHFDDEALHEVTLTEPFDLGKTEVTQAQYEALGVENPSKFKGADRPVEQVNWEEARGWAAKLTKKRDDKHLYRLPTEAEWEYACRGGRPSSKPFGVGDGRAFSSREANCNGNYPYGGADKGPSLKATCRVAKYEANALGLFDMHGNVDEWCADWYGRYPRGVLTNPTGPPDPGPIPIRVVRGGGWGTVGGFCRAAHRGRFAPEFRDDHQGFRLARSLPSSVK